MLGKTNAVSKSGSGGGGSSVAEYVYENIAQTVAFPRKPSTEDTSYLFTSESEYRESSLEFSCYEPSSSIEGMSAFFDGNLTTNGNLINGFFFKFDKPVMLEKIYVYCSGGYEVTLKGTNNPEIATKASDLWDILYTGGADNYDVELKPSQAYQYYCMTKNSGYKTIYELKFYAIVGDVSCVLKSTNMTPIIKAYPKDYMQVVTQDWHNGSEIIPSKTLTLKSYEDGGCLVNYADDGKATNLKMYYLKSNGELINREYSNYEVIGDLKTDVKTGIVSGFNDTTKILIPQTIVSNNWSISLKVKYVATSKHQGLFVDETQFKALGEIRHTIQKMSFWSGSWVDGTVNLEDGAEYWFLFVFANDTWTSYVKKDEGYKVCPNAEEMSVNFTITDFTSRYGSMVGHQLGMGYGESNEYWDSYMDMSTISLVDNSTEIWNASKLSPARDGYVLSPNDNFTLDGYGEKTQVADLNIPAHIYFNGTDWVMGE